MGHPPILLGTLGMSDSLILMVLALVVFGPRRLPQIGRQIGKLMYEFRKASNDFKFQMEEELRNAEEADRRKKEEERHRSLAALAASEQASVSADPQPPVNAIESPNPVETKYPPEYPSETQAGDETAAESVPRIQPPAIGETVPRASRATPSQVETPTNETNTPESGVDLHDPTQPATSTEHTPPDPSQTAEALNQHG